MRFKAIALLAAVASFLGAMPAQANYDEPHLLIDATGQRTKIVVPGTPGQQRIVTYVSESEKLVTTDNCGWVKLYLDSSTTHLASVSWGANTLQTSEAQTYTTEPLCRFATTYQVQAPFGAMPVGSAIKSGNNYWVKLATNVQSVVIKLEVEKDKKITINECGFYAFKIPSSISPNQDIFLVDKNLSTFYSVSGSTATRNPQVCRRPYTNAPNKVLYRPASGFVSF